jgi:hypothetical protein
MSINLVQFMTPFDFGNVGSKVKVISTSTDETVFDP